MDNKLIKRKNKVLEKFKNFMIENKKQDVVIGMSGGIDSSLSLALLSTVLDKKNIHAYFIDINSNDNDFKDAKLVCNQFDIKLKYVNLTQQFINLKNSFESKDTSAQANIKSRLRMMYLYDQAYRKNALVCGNSNFDELYLGYFTKHGDIASDFLILSAFTKSEIISLSHELNIPEKIINKAPTAGLFEDQTDEKDFGFTYKELDDFLDGKKVDDAIKNKIIERHNKNIHKLSYNYDISKSNKFNKLWKKKKQ